MLPQASTTCNPRFRLAQTLRLPQGRVGADVLAEAGGCGRGVGPVEALICAPLRLKELRHRLVARGSATASERCNRVIIA